MTEISALSVAQKAWDCWVAADLDGFLSLWHEDGVWTNAGHSRISGPRQGHQAIGDVARTVFDLSGGTFKAHPVELVASGEHAVLGRFHMVAERGDLILDQEGMQRLVVRDGKLVTLDNLYSDERAMDAFFA
ncbi:MAG: nuclear transport factor 2 family protein [Ilumatobacteraceae bacterium]